VHFISSPAKTTCSFHRTKTRTLVLVPLLPPLGGLLADPSGNMVVGSNVFVRGLASLPSRKQVDKVSVCRLPHGRQGASCCVFSVFHSQWRETGAGAGADWGLLSLVLVMPIQMRPVARPQGPRPVAPCPEQGHRVERECDNPNPPQSGDPGGSTSERPTPE